MKDIVCFHHDSRWAVHSHGVKRHSTIKQNNVFLLGPEPWAEPVNSSMEGSLRKQKLHLVFDGYNVVILVIVIFFNEYFLTKHLVLYL